MGNINMDSLYAVVLAGGKGSRLSTDGTDIPKAMRLVNGKPMLEYVLGSLDFVHTENTVIVVCYQKEYITNAYPERIFAVQESPRGTGDAAHAAADLLRGASGDVIVAYGDNPLIKRETYLSLVEKHRREGNDCTMLGGLDDGTLDYSPYGRIVTDGGFREIIEAKDYRSDSPEFSSYNSGLYVFRADKLFNALERLDSKNAQGELYLTDAPKIILSDGGKIGLLEMELGYQLQGVNTPEELRIVENYLNSLRDR